MLSAMQFPAAGPPALFKFSLPFQRSCKCLQHCRSPATAAAAVGLDGKYHGRLIIVIIRASGLPVWKNQRHDTYELPKEPSHRLQQTNKLRQRNKHSMFYSTTSNSSQHVQLPGENQVNMYQREGERQGERPLYKLRQTNKHLPFNSSSMGSQGGQGVKAVQL